MFKKIKNFAEKVNTKMITAFVGVQVAMSQTVFADTDLSTMTGNTSNELNVISDKGIGVGMTILNWVLGVASTIGAIIGIVLLAWGLYGRFSQRDEETANKNLRKGGFMLLASALGVSAIWVIYKLVINA